MINLKSNNSTTFHQSFIYFHNYIFIYFIHFEIYFFVFDFLYFFDQKMCKCVAEWFNLLIYIYLKSTHLSTL
jgi:hypothetical protein